jgi:hypothetical protein
MNEEKLSELKSLEKDLERLLELRAKQNSLPVKLSRWGARLIIFAISGFILQYLLSYLTIQITFTQSLALLLIKILFL